MDSIKLSVAKDFSRTPGPRLIVEGKNSGEDFRDKILVPMIQKAIDMKYKLVINLDGTAGYATSFLEESFGGLIRNKIFDYDTIIHLIEFISEEDKKLLKNIEEYLREARN